MADQQADAAAAPSEDIEAPLSAEEEEQKRIFYELKRKGPAAPIDGGASTMGGFNDVVRAHVTFGNLRDTKGRPLNKSDQYLILKAHERSPVRMLDAGAPGWGYEAPLRTEEGDRVKFEVAGGGSPWTDRVIRVRAVDYNKYRYLGTNSYTDSDYPHWHSIDWDSDAMFHPTSTSNVYSLATQHTDVIGGGMAPIALETIKEIHATTVNNNNTLKKGGSGVHVQFFNLTKEWSS